MMSEIKTSPSHDCWALTAEALCIIFHSVLGCLSGWKHCPLSKYAPHRLTRQALKLKHYMGCEQYEALYQMLKH